MTPAAEARRQHYAEFYDLAEHPAGATIVVGNCQAESLRIVLQSPEFPTVRIPPVHELTAEDLPHLDRLLSDVAFVISQPIKDDYRGFPLGTRQILARMAPTARGLTIPIVRYTGLHPFQAVIRDPALPEAPPVVDYHDVRELARAAGLPLPESLGRAAVRAIGEDSLTELRRREEVIDVAISDLFVQPSFDLMRTINHPGNPVWLTLGERVLSALGSAATVNDPGRPLLSSIIAPRESWVAAAWDLDTETSPDWVITGEPVTADAVQSAQAAWYHEHPEFVARAVRRLAPTLERWRAA
ncbi:WcbI family polysaccharide biosynthesis putative acetyltransferase [Microbacterium sp. P05]|uniref:WcbI family polysaccharide biosynthesis putative acetyltransferase n=1 Tax=Microbacterium sp. P05 TaxID=3366948 RepID=UPI003744F01A